MNDKLKRERKEEIKSIRNTEDLLNSQIRKAGLISMKEAVKRRKCTRQAIISLANTGTIEMHLIAGTSYVFKRDIDAHPIRGSK